MTSLIDIGQLSAPLTKLVEVTASAIGGLYAPLGEVRRAKAEARAMVIRAEGEENALAARAKSRVAWREDIRQENIEAVVSLAAEELDTTVSEEPVDSDWTLQFFDSAQDVCDADMRRLWAKILAGEVSRPGRFAKRTVQFLRTLDKREAVAFSKFCGYLFQQTGNGWHTVLEPEKTAALMRTQLGREAWIEHFASIGLLSPDRKMVNASQFTGKRIAFHGVTYLFHGPEPKPPTGTLADLELHGVMQDLTQIGQQLALIAEPPPVEDFVPTISDHLEERIKVSLHRLDA